MATVTPQRELDVLVLALVRATQILPHVTPLNAAEERARLAADVAAGRDAVPDWRYGPVRLDGDLWRRLDAARTLARGSAAAALYLERLDQLELDLALVAARGEPRRVRPIVRRRFGAPDDPAEDDFPPGRAGGAPRSLRDVAASLLAVAAREDEARTLPVDAPADAGPSLAGMVREAARRIGLAVEVRVEPRLAASAATGPGVVFLAPRTYGAREARRLVVHEVFGHLVAGANAERQPLGIFEAGTARSFADQEGMCVALEEEAGLLGGGRLRTLAARVLACDAMHQGAAFAEAVRLLVRAHGLPPADAVVIAERAYRGGGVARDVAYLQGWLRVRAATARGEASVDALRTGRVGVRDLPALSRLVREGLAVEAAYRPSLDLSFAATPAGTSLLTSPPSVAASFTRFELT